MLTWLLYLAALLSLAVIAPKLLAAVVIVLLLTAPAWFRLVRSHGR